MIDVEMLDTKLVFNQRDPETTTIFDVVPEYQQLFVIHNNIAEIMTFEEIFDSEKYNTIDVISYVSSPKYFSKIIEKFKYARVILGIDKPSALKRIRDLMTGESVKLFNRLTSLTRDNIVSGKIQIQYSAKNEVIHSKLYILSNDKTSEFRIITGSANLTENAFLEKKRKQYEELRIDDFSSKTSFVESEIARFNYLWSQTVDIIPTQSKELWSNERTLLKIDDPDVLMGFIKSLPSLNNVSIICEDLSSELEDEIKRMEENPNEYSEDEKNVIYVWKSASKKKGDKRILKSEKEISKINNPIFQSKILSLCVGTTTDDQHLKRLVKGHGENGSSVLYLLSSVDSETGFSEKKQWSQHILSPEKINDALSIIEEFILTYRTYSPLKISDEYLSWIYEAIIFSMSSPVNFDIREYVHKLPGDDISQCPIWLIIGGRSNTGKSVLLNFCAKLVLNENSWAGDHQYGEMTKIWGSELKKYFEYNSRLPLFADEIQPGLLNGISYDRAVKEYTNKLGEYPYGSIILTSNVDNYAPQQGSARRMKFLRIDKGFALGDNSGKAQINELTANAPYQLTQEFCARWLFAFDNGESPYCLDATHCFDSLGLARQVFIELYNESGREIPKFFPTSLPDATGMGLQRWKDLWEDDRKKQYFVPIENNTLLKIDMNELWAGKSAKEKDLKIYTNSIPSHVFDSAAGMYIRVNRKLFFEWIGCDDPFKNTFASKFKAKFRKIKGA